MARTLGAGSRILVGDRTRERKDAIMFRKQFTDVQDAYALAHAIVDTVREPLVVLDEQLRVVAASRSFYLTFKVNRDETQGRLLFELGDGAWDIPKLRLLLGKIIPERGEMEDYEVDHDFPDIGRRTMLLNARKVFYEVGSHANIILLGIEDVTGKRALEREKDELLQQKDVLLDEIQHRIANSLQINAPSFTGRAHQGYFGCSRATAPPRFCSHRLHGNAALLDEALRGSLTFDDRRRSAGNPERRRRRRHSYLSQRREPGFDRHGACYKLSQICVQQREE